eukprot:gnl/TRDRNA2_/TRDRNA2_47202_c0_seq2.p1 gnl/TRDRNA2_/TRDRNA2_47202_c0~~gnl/TRDRNA2_/TRDRNA2_47202_c0_seq2.p1  ORF type:complete len:358 (-),score=76.62 gnl/TRDRNA2_/TRDRNA2_47202_c0_seq2:40-1020(-)
MAPKVGLQVTGQGGPIPASGGRGAAPRYSAVARAPSGGAAARSSSGATRGAPQPPTLHVAGQGSTAPAAADAPGVRAKNSEAKAAAGRAKGKARASKVLSGAVSAERREYEAATRLQVWWHQWMRRCVARRERQRMIQERLEEQQEREERAARAAAAAAALEAQEKARREADARREAELRAFRDRRSVVEVMCQGLPSYTMPWEEEPSELVAYLEQRGKGKYTAEWLLGRHSTKKAARRRYLELARKWHPDKWAQQGEASVAVATDLTKCLVLAYEQLMKDLPQESSAVSCEDDDEDREVCEFASWVGVSFVGMKEVYAERKGVKR